MEFDSIMPGFESRSSLFSYTILVKYANGEQVVTPWFTILSENLFSMIPALQAELKRLLSLPYGSDGNAPAQISAEELKGYKLLQEINTINDINVTGPKIKEEAGVQVSLGSYKKQDIKQQ